jgi:hypothetical protein
VRVSVGGRSVDIGSRLAVGFHRLTLPIQEGLRVDLTIEAVVPLDLIRVTAFSPMPGVQAPDGPVLMPTASWCGSL